ncbi:MAG: hypothetical protein WCQ23_07490 [Candidatus Methanomethylophilaceae archaeon]
MSGDRITSKMLLERADRLQESLREKGFDVKIKPYFAYGAYSFLFIFKNGRQIDTGFGTPRECWDYLDRDYFRTLANINGSYTEPSYAKKSRPSFFRSLFKR